MTNRWQPLVAYVAAVLDATLLGSIVQTQFNLAALSALGAEISFTTRLATTGHDLLGFTPLYGSLIAIMMLGAMPAASVVTRWLGSGAWLIHALAAALGLWVTLWIVDTLAPMPTLIAATRSLEGTLAMMATAALGGWGYAILAYFDWDGASG
ncbi:hypothetical protein GCM10007160_22270 [Litchfieldella qijiaojingensis]|uniref:DUF2177 family protein n=1 Tax=Litchfieldella qijiaojingensis TaxID=980347 RepID=A0ABQ2YW72_9GAMM|nr:hypothetical protein [Halomonas qijiaojingensis]GGX94211.1 hypothetical protein GCM10007160_22270 [Halomonas qijiaojingensis]